MKGDLKLDTHSIALTNLLLHLITKRLVEDIFRHKYIIVGGKITKGAQGQQDRIPWRYSRVLLYSSTVRQRAKPNLITA